MKHSSMCHLVWCNLVWCNLAIIACIVFSLRAEATTAALPQFDDLDLSSDGERLLMVRAQDNTYALIVRDLSIGADRLLYQGSPETGLINWCRWANTTRILCSIRFYTQAPRLGYVTATRMFAINFDGTDRIDLIPRARNRDRWPLVWNAQVQDRVISWLTDEPEYVLIQLNRDHPNRPSVYRLNIYTNQLIRVQRPREKVRRWYASHEGKVRLAIGYRFDEVPYLYRVAGRRLLRFAHTGFQSEIPPQPIGFTADGRHAFVSMTNNHDRHGIYRLDLDNGQLLEEVFRNPAYDVFGGLIQHPGTGEPVGVGYTGHHPRFHWFDSDFESLYARVQRQLPGRYLRLIASDSNYRRLMLYNYGGISPGYYLYDIDSHEAMAETQNLMHTPALQLIGKDHPELADDAVVDLRPVTYPSRDGTPIPAYLAEPLNGTPPYPTVLLPHGGPYARDSAEFDSWTQFLVDAGYAVLKPNYRGSVGYGEAYMQAGYKQWGLKMQEDLIDGLSWLVEENIADPDRVCMVGASYGGYSALVSAFKFHDRIRCAVSMAGISDLQAMVQRIYRFDLSTRNRKRIQPSRELQSNSPLHQVEAIQSPILLLHGAQDTVVRVRQSRRLASALEQTGKSFRYVEQPEGDHFLSYSDQREQLFAEMQSFLADHLGSNGSVH